MPEKARKLLVVDDETIVRQSIVAYLEDSGFDVIEANNGRLGLELFKKYNPDLVVTDLKMPQMDGLELLGEIHKIDLDIPVIVVSGAGVMGDVVEALRLGACDYMFKPLVDMEMLVHTISKSLERKELLEQNRRYREDLEALNQKLQENLLTLEKDQEAGRRVQQQLLPASPFETSTGYVAEHKIIPSLYLSGDFIDFTYKSDHYLGFYLTDVSGHGSSSAFATIWLKHVATALARRRILVEQSIKRSTATNGFLYALNNELLNSRLGHHMTCFTGLIDMEKNTLNYSVAGHLPMPIISTPDGPRYLEGKGRPLGLFPDQDWDFYEIDFPKGSTLVGFSDGVLEVLPPKDLIEKEVYLLDMVSQGNTTLDQIMSALNIEALESVPDDIAILSISRGY